MELSNEENYKNADIALAEILKIEGEVMEPDEVNIEEPISVKDMTKVGDEDSDTCSNISSGNISDKEKDTENVLSDKNTYKTEFQEIFLINDTCIHCTNEIHCQFLIDTPDGETKHFCKEKCLKNYQRRNPGKYFLTHDKYIIHEIRPKVQICSECKENVVCYFYYKCDGIDTYHCSMRCLTSMMGQEKDKFIFKWCRISIEKVERRDTICMVCNQEKQCSFTFVRYGEHHYVCSQNCITVLNRLEGSRYLVKYNRPIDAHSQTIPSLLKLKVVSSGTNKYIQLGTHIPERRIKKVIQAAKIGTFIRSCTQCSLILNMGEHMLTWKAMDFCNGICWRKYQNEIGAKCAKCTNTIPHTSVGKYCVRFENEIHQFCNSNCLVEFKLALKICCFCGQNISAGHQGLSVENKKFCSQFCMEKFDLMSKNPVSQMVWAKCAVCSLEKALTIELKVTENSSQVTENSSQRLCSEYCFSAYKFINSIYTDQCHRCKKYFESKLSRYLTIFEDNPPCCSCLEEPIIVRVNHKSARCNWCKVKQNNLNIIRYVQRTGQRVMMCSLTCLDLYQLSKDVIPLESIMEVVKLDSTTTNLNCLNGRSPIGRLQLEQTEVTDVQTQPPLTTSVNETIEESAPVTEDLDASFERCLEQNSDDDEKQFEHYPESNYLMSTHLLDDLDHTTQTWLANEDKEADQMFQELLSTDHLTFDWNCDPTTFIGRRETFMGPSGPTFTITETTKPVDIFLKFCDIDYFDLLTTQTCNYSINNIDSHLTPNTRLDSDKYVDRNEIAIFHAILIFQSLAPLTMEKDYWAENGYLTFKYFGTLMTYNRFLFIKKLLHFESPDAKQIEAKDEMMLRKIQPILENFKNKFSTLYFPGQEITIDESLLKSRGRKIDARGGQGAVKSCELYESATGYLWDFCFFSENFETDAYQSDQTNSNYFDSTTNVSLLSTKSTAKTVYELTKQLFNRGHTLIVDSFYNSPLLARCLKSQGTDCYGTLRVNREFIPDTIKNVSKNELRNVEIVQSFCRDLHVIMHDINLLSMLSTYHADVTEEIDKSGIYKYKPQIVLDYNITKRKLNKKDQMLSEFSMTRPCHLNWYDKVFRSLLNVTLLNAFIIYKTFDKKVSQRNFRFEVAEDLVKICKKPTIKRPLKVSVEEVVVNDVKSKKTRPILEGNHFIGPGVSKHCMCIWCKKSRSKYICKQCKVSLCLQICFEEFHTVPNAQRS